VAAVNPFWIWVALTASSVVVGGGMLWIAFAVVNKRQREQQGFGVKPNTAGAESAALREKEHHG
jgi:hypothetical protein